MRLPNLFYGQDDLILKILDLKVKIRIDELRYDEAVRVNNGFEIELYKSMIIFRNRALDRLVKNLIKLDAL